VNVDAIKMIIAENLQKYMAEHHITQIAMAKQLQTSRSGLQRLLDPHNYSVILLTLNRAASVIGKKFAINLISDSVSHVHK
jgi:antitoxin HicB